MKKCTKRILAFLLTIVMVTTALPMSAKDVKASETSFTLDLTAATQGAYDPNTGTIGATSVQGQDFRLTTTYAGDGWRLNPNNTTLPISEEGSTVYDLIGCNSNYDAPGAAVSVRSGFQALKFNYGNTVEFSFDAPAAGKYMVSIRYYANSTPEKMNVTVNGTNQVFPQCKINDSTMRDYAFTNPVTLVAGGSNTLVFTHSRDSLAEVSIASVTFTKVASAEPTSAPTQAPTATPTAAPTVAPTATPKPTEDPNAVKKPFTVSATTVDESTIKTLDNRAFYFGTDTVGANWAVHSSMNPAHLLTGSSVSGVARVYVGRYIQLYKGNSDFVLSFTAPASGYYDLLANVHLHASCGYADVYVNDQYVGTLDGYIDVPNAEQKLLGVYLNGGELANTIKLKATGKSHPDGYGYFIFKDFAFTTPETVATLTGIELDVPATLMYVGENQTVAGNGALTNGGLYRFSGDGKTVIYESTNPAVATINSEGVVEALSVGTTTITASVLELGYVDTVEITVKELLYEKAELNLKDGQKFIEGDTLTLEPKAKLNSDEYVDASLVSVAYESTNESVAKVENGVLYAFEPGEATITAHITYNGKTLDVVCNVTVNEIVPPAPFTVSAVTVDASTVRTLDYKAFYFGPETVGANWAVHSSMASAQLLTGSSASGVARVYLSDSVGRYLQIFKAKSDFVLSFTAPGAGYYDIASNVILNAKCGYVDVYVNDQYIGTLDGYIGVSSAEQKLLGAYLKGGELANTLKLVATGKSHPDGNAYFIFEDFAFTTPETIATLTGLEIVAPTTLMYVGDTQTVAGNGSLTNGGLYRFTSAGHTVIYESSNPAVATITSEGVVNALSRGTTTITARVPELGYADTIEITVEDLLYEKAELNLKEGQYFVEGDTLTLEPMAKYNSGKYVDESLISTTYESSDETVAKIENGVLYALVPGEATITAHVTFNGQSLDASYNIIVEKYVPPVAFELNFVNLKNYYSASSSMWLSLETSGKNWTVSDKTDATLATDQENLGRCRAYPGSVFPYLILLQNGKTIVFDLYVDIPGDYDITANMVKYEKGGYATVHVNGEYVGTVDSYASKTDLYRTSDQPLLGVHLNKGVNEISVTVAGKSQGTGSYTSLKGFSFTAPEEIAKITAIEATADVDNMYVGRKENISVEAILSNGGFYEFSRSNETFTYESDNTSVATVSSAGQIVGVSAGTATITVTAVNSGLSDTITFDVSDAVYEKAEMNISEGENLYLTKEKELEVVATLADGTIISSNDLVITYTSSDPSVAKVENGVLTAVAKGNTTITAEAKFTINSTVKTDVKNIVVTTIPLQGITAETVKPVVQELDKDGVQLVVKGIAEDGAIIDDFATIGFDTYDFAYTALTPEILSIDENGLCYYISRGDAQVKVEALIDGVLYEQVVNVVSSSQKTGRTLYTDDMVENARYNVTNYKWAAKELEKRAGIAYEFVVCMDQIYDLIPSEGIPRSYENSTVNAPDNIKWICPVCNVDLNQTEANLTADPLVEPWKIWCTNCQTRFPSNDFALLYERGLDENGEYNRELAYQRNAEAVARGEKDALVNELYPELGATWMVDDGFGWSPTSGTYGTLDMVQYTPIALYMYKWLHGQSKASITYLLGQLSDYYLWTGDERFGRAGAILLDRVADLYPSYDIAKVSLNYHNSHGGGNSGKLLGSITEGKEIVDKFAQCYDSFYPMYDDPEVIAYLSKKAAEKGLANPKTNGNLIRENIENGLLRESFESAKTCKVYGNFGLHHRSLTMVAVALDTQPETNQIFEWLNAPSTLTKTTIYDPVFGGSYSARTSNTGGGIVSTFVNEIDRDGFGGEVAIGYNTMWLNTVEIAEVLENYDTSIIDLYENPKFVNMFETFIHLTGGGGGNTNLGYTFQFGDGGTAASGLLNNFATDMLMGYKATKDPVLAQLYYAYNGGEINNLNIGIYNNVKELTAQIESDIATYGEYELQSLNLTGYGLSIVRGGKAATKENQYETRYDTWMYYGRTNIAHSHLDMLQMGIDAYGFNFMPDFGNPEAKGYSSNRYEWIRNTISHNTVTVNEIGQTGAYTGTPLHYDVTDNVKIIDNECADAYGVTDIYRRSLVTIAANDDVSYTIDFFRVKGGDKHTYSFHSQSYKHFFTEDLDLVPQVNEKGEYAGTYAGVDVPYGPDPNSTDTQYADNPVYPRGYTWLTDVNRGKDKTGDGIFKVKFEQSNWKDQVVDAGGLAMNVYAVNDWEPDSVDIMVGYPPRIEDNANIPGYDYMLIQRSGENLDTLFTTVLEPFKVDSYIQKVEPIEATIVSGEEVADDIVKAVKVTLKNGRTDYVIYATNNAVTYNVTDGDVNFNFAGFVGVYTIDYFGNNTYSYANDGTIIGNETSVGTYTGIVVDFTKELVMDDYIIIDTDQEVEDLSIFENQYIYVENPNSKCNGAFRIISAEKQGEYIALYLGNCSLIEGYIDDYDLEAGFIYTIEDGQNFRIPVSNSVGMKFSGTNAPTGAVDSSSVNTLSAGTSTLEIDEEVVDDVTSSELHNEALDAGKVETKYDTTPGDVTDDASEGKDNATTTTEGQSATEGGEGTPTPGPDAVDSNAGSGKTIRNILLGGLGVVALGAGIFLILLGKKKEEDEA